MRRIAARLCWANFGTRSGTKPSEPQLTSEHLTPHWQAVRCPTDQPEEIS